MRYEVTQLTIIYSTSIYTHRPS